MYVVCCGHCTFTLNMSYNRRWRRQKLDIRRTLCHSPPLTSWEAITNPKPSPCRLLSSTSTDFTPPPPPLPSLGTAPSPPSLSAGGPPALSSTPNKSRGSKVSVTGTESRKLVLWMRAEAGGPLGVWAGGAPKDSVQLYLYSVTTSVISRCLWLRIRRHCGCTSSKNDHSKETWHFGFAWRAQDLLNDSLNKWFSFASFWLSRFTTKSILLKYLHSPS